MPTVSVIIPTYNHRAFILETCESVFKQTYTDYEIIVVNDASPDDTKEVLRPLAEAGKIRYIDQPHAGQAAARNRGLAEATGEFVAFLDDDDLWVPDKLEWQVKLMEEYSNVVLIYGYCGRVGDGDRWRWPDAHAPTGDVRQPFLTQNWIVSPGQALMRRQTLYDVGGFDETIWGADDWDLYIRMSRWGDFIFENRVGLYHRVHADNASKDYWRMYGNSEKLLYKHLGAFPNPLNIPTWLACRNWITLQFISECIQRAHSLSSRGERKAALHQWGRIVMSRPELLAKGHVLRGIFKCLLGFRMPAVATK